MCGFEKKVQNLILKIWKKSVAKVAETDDHKFQNCIWDAGCIDKAKKYENINNVYIECVRKEVNNFKSKIILQKNRIHVKPF